MEEGGLQGLDMTPPAEVLTVLTRSVPLAVVVDREDVVEQRELGAKVVEALLRS